MKHPGDISHALQRTALLLLCALIGPACLAQPGIVQCDEQTGCRAGYECFEGTCIEPDVCGNGKLEPESGEQCEDGNVLTGDGCGSTCQDEVCGNLNTDPAETCDDGNTVSGDDCSSTCQLEVCGNGIQDLGEECDDGNTMSGDGCSSTCQLEVCGNAIVDQTRSATVVRETLRQGALPAENDRTPSSAGTAAPIVGFTVEMER